MSKIGKKDIIIPQGVTISISDIVDIQGPKGKNNFPIHAGLSFVQNDNVLTIQCNDESHRALRGTSRAIVAHMIEGVSQGFEKKLQVIGVGYDASIQGTDLFMKLGFSHPVIYPIPMGISAKVEKDPKGNAVITLNSHDKQLIGAVAANIRKLKKPEPYKGKGIRYFGEVIKLKAGKTSKK